MPATVSALTLGDTASTERVRRRPSSCLMTLLAEPIDLGAQQSPFEGLAPRTGELAFVVEHVAVIATSGHVKMHRRMAMAAPTSISNLYYG